MQNDSFKMRQHYAPYNRSEESHRRTDGYMYFFILVVGYFAIAQYDVKTPIGTSCHFPRRRKRGLFYCLCSLGIDAMTDCFIVFASGAKQSPGRVKTYGV